LPRLPALFQILRVITRRDQKDEKFIAVRRGAQFPASSIPLLRATSNLKSKREHCLPIPLRRLPRAGRNNFMAASFDQPLQSPATLRMIFNEQYSHFWSYESSQNPRDQVCASMSGP